LKEEQKEDDEFNLMEERGEEEDLSDSEMKQEKMPFTNEVKEREKEKEEEKEEESEIERSTISLISKHKAELSSYRPLSARLHARFGLDGLSALLVALFHPLFSPRSLLTSLSSYTTICLKNRAHMAQEEEEEKQLRQREGSQNTIEGNGIYTAKSKRPVSLSSASSSSLLKDKDELVSRLRFLLSRNDIGVGRVEFYSGGAFVDLRNDSARQLKEMIENHTESLTSAQLQEKSQELRAISFPTSLPEEMFVDEDSSAVRALRARWSEGKTRFGHTRGANQEFGEEEEEQKDEARDGRRGERKKKGERRGKDRESLGGKQRSFPRFGQSDRGREDRGGRDREDRGERRERGRGEEISDSDRRNETQRERRRSAFSR